MRERLVSALAKEVLGPRNGPREILEGSPVFEYLTGILAPRTSSPDTLEGEAVLTGAEELTEDTEGDAGATDPPVFSPILNPKAFPHSIGLTFGVTGDESTIEIAATWGQYYSHEGAWLREPYYMLVGPVSVSGRIYHRWDPDTLVARVQHSTNAQGKNVSLHCYVRRQPGGWWLVSIFLSNDIVVEGRRPAVEDHLFQPEIRVLLGNGGKLVPLSNRLRSLTESDPDDASLRLLYHDTHVLARGHMCAAVWSGIDPQRPSASPEVEARRPQGPPFTWVDAEVLPQRVRQRFLIPDVRTELVPIVPVPMPELEWPGPEAPTFLDAGRLAETWEPTALERELRHLVDGYRSWIDGTEERVSLLDPSLRAVAERHVTEARRALQRMEDAIRILTEDDDARLAFCFANKAMALQYGWGRPGERLVWRPFQMGFILTVIPSLVDKTRPDREDCDLLWLPTAAGKTEAYLGLVAFTLALRRLRARARDSSQDRSGAGVSVISRYTLRLLTIQQFRRTLRLVTACEILRVTGLGSGGPVGWRPKACDQDRDWLWGSSRFSVGLWVGGGVTPNHLYDVRRWDGRRQVHIRNAIGKLRGLPDDSQDDSDPAQVLTCPSCGTILAVPESGLPAGTHRLFFVCSSPTLPSSPEPSSLSSQAIRVHSARVIVHPWAPHGRVYWTLELQLSVTEPLRADTLDEWWKQKVVPNIPECTLESARPSRPGYFIRRFALASRAWERDVDFDLFCPNPNADECALSTPWAEGVPTTGMWGSQMPLPPDGLRWAVVPSAFRGSNGDPGLACRVPIPAVTVDDQVYHRVPSVVVATVDKFARLPFEPKSAALFGNVDAYHAIYGYYRQGVPPSDPIEAPPESPHEHPRPDHDGRGQNRVALWVPVPHLDPPDLVLQDELHLIDGPLGSLVGVLETAFDTLASVHGIPCKYIASTATIRKSEAQVEAVFNRTVRLFPPPGLTFSDSFFLRQSHEHPLEAARAGRLYMGVCAPGKGAQTPIARIWARLLQEVYEELSRGVPYSEADPYWTLTGYFNSIRELAGARALFQQDVRERISAIARTAVRSLPDLPIELSSRMASTDLPSVLDALNTQLPGAAPDAVLTTSMFGVGVDIPRLGLMVMHGQPKRTSDYIQATGRIGRRAPGLVVTLYRATRPRDLSHYEFFAGYHLMLHRFVEPVSVFPFAPGARSRLMGSVLVALLRCARALGAHPVPRQWAIELRGVASGAHRMASERQSAVVLALPKVLRARAERQPEGRRIPGDRVEEEAMAALDTWAAVASRCGASLAYWEYAPNSPPSFDVVLGDAWHERSGREIVYRNTPQSLREVEETIGIEV